MSGRWIALLCCAACAHATPPCRANGAAAVHGYAELEADPRALRSMDVRFDADSGSWLPEPALRMPHHHASNIEWLNAPAGSSQVLRFEFVVEHRQLERSRRRGYLVDARYRLRVLDVCRPPSAAADTEPK